MNNNSNTNNNTNNNTNTNTTNNNNWVEQKQDPYILVILAKVLHAFPNNFQNGG